MSSSNLHLTSTYLGCCYFIIYLTTFVGQLAFENNKCKPNLVTAYLWLNFINLALVVNCKKVDYFCKFFKMSSIYKMTQLFEVYALRRVGEIGPLSPKILLPLDLYSFLFLFHLFRINAELHEKARAFRLKFI